MLLLFPRSSYLTGTVLSYFCSSFHSLPAVLSLRRSFSFSTFFLVFRPLSPPSPFPFRLPAVGAACRRPLSISPTDGLLRNGQVMRCLIKGPRQTCLPNVLRDC